MNEIFIAYTGVVGTGYFLLIFSWMLLIAFFGVLFDRFVL